MSIDVYATHIEASDPDTGFKMFEIKMFDEYCATLTLSNQIVNDESLDDLFSAIRQGVAMLKLKKCDA